MLCKAGKTETTEQLEDGILTLPASRPRTGGPDFEALGLALLLLGYQPWTEADSGVKATV